MNKNSRGIGGLVYLAGYILGVILSLNCGAGILSFFWPFLIIIALIGIINAIPILFTHYKTSFLDMLFKTKVVDLTYLDEGDIDEKDEAMPL